MKQTLAICDLDAAVAARGSTGLHNTKCLMAQFARRISGKTVMGSSYTGARFRPEYGTGSLDVKGMKDLVSLFDDSCYKHKSSLIATIRRQLPLEVEVTYK